MILSSNLAQGMKPQNGIHFGPVFFFSLYICVYYSYYRVRYFRNFPAIFLQSAWSLVFSRMGISSFVSSPSTHAWSSSTSKTSKEGCSSMSFPVLEMFFFRRVIFDELHELQGETKGEKLPEKIQGWG